MGAAALLPALITAGGAIGGGFLAGRAGGKSKAEKNILNTQNALGQAELSQLDFRNAMIKQLWPEFWGELMKVAPYIDKATAPADALESFAKERMDLGSPYYREQQRQTFEQGVKQSDDAAAQTRQAIARSGMGSAPSGAGIAAMGEMGTAKAGTLASNWLANLFQNQNTQLQAAGFMPTVAGMRLNQGQSQLQLADAFNPAGGFLSNVPRQPSVGQSYPTNPALAQGISTAGDILSQLFKRPISIPGTGRDIPLQGPDVTGTQIPMIPIPSVTGTAG
jgi:hypothetical protein